MGGHVAHVVGVVQGLKDLGHHVTVLTEESFELLDGIADDIVTVPCQSSKVIDRLLWNFSFVKAARRFEGSVDAAYMRYSVGFSPFITALKKSLGECPLMLEVNSFLSQRKPVARFIEGRFIAAADHVLTVSERNRDEMLQYFGDSIESKVFVVTNGVDLSRFDAWEASVGREWSSPVVFGYAGIIKDWYGLDTMLDGYRLLRAKFPNIAFQVIGDGPYRNTLEDKYNDVEGLEFLGPQPFERMPELLSSIDVLVNSATAKNAFQSPTKMFEYMASCRPILSARTPQCEVLLQEGDLGALYELDDAESFAAVAGEIIEQREHSMTKARLARAEAELQHSWTAKCESFLSMITIEKL
tara:strand:- start:2784 stop:3851 length:1068 start_codon:yes stop_codon:yes gene_type:complete